MRLEQKDPFSSPKMGSPCQLVREDPSGVTEGCRKEQEAMPAISHKLELMSIDSAEQSLWKPCVWGLWESPLTLLMHQPNLNSLRRQHLGRGDSYTSLLWVLCRQADFPTCPSVFCCLVLEESLVLWVEAFLPCVHCTVWLYPCLHAFSVPWGDKHVEALH